MLKAVAEDIGAYYQHYPRTAAIVTACQSGRKNALAVAWHCPVSFKPALYGISLAPKRFTYHMISESREFGINFVPYDKASVIAALGGSSGSFTDKFSVFNIGVDRAVKTEVPVLSDAYAVYECKVVENRMLGDHAWIVGEVLAVHVAENVFNNKGVIELDTVKPALYLGADMYCTADKVSSRVYERDKYGKS
jgi:flavin reductase (DIM6/NTAB) family NADH-FMN oxidoreductase RutF